MKIISTSVNCYTANLAAFLTNTKMDSSINSAKDLVNQQTVKIGVVGRGTSFKTMKVTETEKKRPQ